MQIYSSENIRQKALDSTSIPVYLILTLAMRNRHTQIESKPVVTVLC